MNINLYLNFTKIWSFLKDNITIISYCFSMAILLYFGMYTEFYCVELLQLSVIPTYLFSIIFMLFLSFFKYMEYSQNTFKENSNFFSIPYVQRIKQLFQSLSYVLFIGLVRVEVIKSDIVTSKLFKIIEIKREWSLEERFKMVLSWLEKKNIQDSLRVPMHDDLYKLCEEHTSISDLHKSFEALIDRYNKCQTIAEELVKKAKEANFSEQDIIKFHEYVTSMGQGKVTGKDFYEAYTSCSNELALIPLKSTSSSSVTIQSDVNKKLLLKKINELNQIDPDPALIIDIATASPTATANVSTNGQQSVISVIYNIFSSLGNFIYNNAGTIVVVCIITVFGVVIYKQFQVNNTDAIVDSSVLAVESISKTTEELSKGLENLSQAQMESNIKLLADIHELNSRHGNVLFFLRDFYSVPESQEVLKRISTNPQCKSIFYLLCGLDDVELGKVIASIKSIIGRE